jgi:hypothetical protein
MKHLKLFENYNFDQKMHELDEDDYNPIALEYANRYYKDETNPRGAYGDYFEILDRLHEFCETDFPYGIKNIPETVTLYRLLNVDNEESINKDKLGLHYVGDKDMFDDYDFVESFMHRYGEKTKKWFVVKIETEKENIDLGQTLGNRAEYPNEFEISLKDDNNLKIIEIEEIDPI